MKKSAVKAGLGVGVATCIIFAASSMRAPISGVGSLISLIKSDLSLSSAVSGLLTTIPLLLFAAVAPFAAAIFSRFKLKSVMLASFFAICSGVLVRSYLGTAGLFLGTALLGFGIGTLNVVMPAYAKQVCPERVGFVTGLYTTVMTAFAALSSGTSVILASRLGSWKQSLALYAVLPAFALIAWSLSKPVSLSGGAGNSNFITTSKDNTNRRIALFMGTQSLLYFSMIAWLPSMLVEKGVTRGSSAIIMLVLQLISLPPSFLFPIYAQRSRNKVTPAVIIALTYGFGFASVAFAAKPGLFMWLGVVFLGTAAGMGLSTCLAFIAIKGKDRFETANLSAFSHTVGYLIAAPGPTLIGWIYDKSAGWSFPLVVFVAISALCIVLGASAGRGLNKHIGR